MGLCQLSKPSARFFSSLLIILQFMTISAFIRRSSSGSLAASPRVFGVSKRLFARRSIIELLSVSSDDASPSAFLPTISTSTAKQLRKTQPTSKENAGIRVIKDNSDFMVLWKTSNVAIHPGERLLRPASIPVSDWLSSYLSCDYFTMPFQHLLSSDTSGISVIAVSQLGDDFLAKSTESDTASLSYETILHDSETPSNGGNFNEQPISSNSKRSSVSDRLEALTESMTQTVNRGNGAGVATSTLKFTLTRSENSGTHGTLSLVKITYAGPRIPSYLSPKLVEQSLASVGLKCYREGTKPFLSLVEIEITRDKVLCVRESTPSKFLKLLRREDLLYKRLQEREVITGSSRGEALTATDRDNVGNGVDSRSLQSVQFMGLNIQVSDFALTPRESSSILVRQAIIKIQQSESSSALTNEADGGDERQEVQKQTRSLRILDLGCGSGALLLATLSGLQSASISAIGVGVDLDEKALDAAKINAACNGQPVCAWIQADFGKLHTQAVRHLLTNAVAGCEGSMTGVSRVDGREGLFQVIVCNPPYLSSRAAAGRVTVEGQSVLVGGLTGMEPYIAICSSVLAACNSMVDDEVSSIGGNGSSNGNIVGQVGLSDVTVSSASASGEVSEGGGHRLLQKALISRSKKVLKDNKVEVVKQDPEGIFFSSLPLLAPGGSIVFQVPGGERGWQDVLTAVRHIGGFSYRAVEDEKGVKRCLVLTRLQRPTD